MMQKSAAESRTEQVQIIGHNSLNGFSRLFGGRLLEWIDIVAGVVARRHSCMNVTTAAIDSLEFRRPAYANDTIVLLGHITWTGRTSMEVCVETYTEQLSGQRELINKAYLILVALDENEQPAPVPQLKVETAEEQAEWAAALERKRLRALKRNIQ
jgi:acyl-CoA hydrolase